jgi:single-strand binding family protein
MNEKSLSKQELGRLFRKFDFIENINEIHFLGSVAKASVSSRGVPNPHFSSYKAGDERYETMRMTLEIPSPYRKGAHSQPYKTRIPIFTTDEFASRWKAYYENGGKLTYAAGTGSLQNYNVVAEIKYEREFIWLLRDVVSVFGLRDEKAYEIARELGMMNGRYDKNYVTLTGIWSNTFYDGDELAKWQEEKEEIVQRNEVLLQGLVHMPPSIRMMGNTGDFILHFKMRIKRSCENSAQHIPRTHWKTYDFINVIAFGDQCDQWYDKLRQGHPVRVKGRVESSKYRKIKKMSPKERWFLAKMFQIKKDDSIIQTIADFFDTHSVVVSYPTFNVWAESIETDLV